MGINFKFKSEKTYDSIAMNDPFISVDAFKQEVYELRYKGKKNADGLCFGNDFDIMVINAQTNESYDDKMLLPNHTSVLIQRVPGAKRCRFINTTTIVVPGSQIPKSSSASNSNNSTSASRSSTITTSSNCGNIPADASGKNTESVNSEKVCSFANNFPVELVCPLCKQLMKHATFTSRCCFNSFCDECIRDHLILSNCNCICGATDMLTDYLIPNITVRGLIHSMLDSGFTIPQPQKSASTTASGLAMHPQTSAGDSGRVAQPHKSTSADVPVSQPQASISASKSPSMHVAVEEAALQQKFVAHETGKKKRKRENSGNLEATESHLMHTGFFK